MEPSGDNTTSIHNNVNNNHSFDRNTTDTTRLWLSFSSSSFHDDEVNQNLLDANANIEYDTAAVAAVAAMDSKHDAIVEMSREEEDSFDEQEEEEQLDCCELDVFNTNNKNWNELQTETTTTTATTKNNKSNNNDNNDKKWRLREELVLLHQEMEVAQYAITEAGQRRRKVPRPLAKTRTNQRKALEKKDRLVYALNSSPLKQIRGSKAAVQDDILQASLIFFNDKITATTTTTTNANNNNNTLQDGEEQPPHKNPTEQGKDNQNINFTLDPEEEIVGPIEDDDVNDHDDEEGDPIGEDMDVDEEIIIGDQEGEEHLSPTLEELATANDISHHTTTTTLGGAHPKKFKKKLSRPSSTSTLTKRRRLYRLRNFKSHRMAQRHGEALGALVQGKPQLAIHKLKQLANDAPSAPQIYSSLGMVYEDLLRERRRQNNYPTPKQQQQSPPTPSQHSWPTDSIHINNNNSNNNNYHPMVIPDAELAEQIEIAKKAYGAYHVAAILCRRDFSLWVRAADMALEIADCYTEARSLYQNDVAVQFLAKTERQRWFQEAKNDYQKADRLKPPGIHVPCKLAAVQIQLGLFSEALTLLTDLKNRPSSSGMERSEFDASYQGWLLYADLMLRIGHECVEWNAGRNTLDNNNNNYMVRRWLRKWAQSFDWRERRLQALARALEAAAGTNACRTLLVWLQSRATRETKQPEEKTDTRPKENTLNNNNHGEDNGNNRDEKADDDDDEDNLQDKELLDETCRQELDNFDKTTRDLCLEKNSAAALERVKTRAELVEKLKSANTLITLAQEAWDEKCWTKGDLPLRASVRTVCTIAADLMRLFLDCDHGDGLLCQGCCFVGEAVSAYFRQRAQRTERKQQKKAQFLLSMTGCLDWETTLQTNTNNYDEEVSSCNSEDESLSDEEEMSGEDGSRNISESLRLGILPPELMFMYGLACAGLGGRDFVALKCLESLASIPQEDFASWLVSATNPTDKVTAETRWVAFQTENEGEFQRTRALAFAANVLLKLEKDTSSKYTSLLVQLFGDQEAWIVQSGLIREGGLSHGNSLKTKSSSKPLVRCPLQELRMGVVVSTLAAAIRYRTLHIKSTMQSSNVDPQDILNLFHSVQTLANLLPAFWVLNPDKTLSPLRISTLSTGAEAICLIVQEAENPASKIDPGDVVRCVGKWLAAVCGLDDIDLLSRGASGFNATFAELPFQAKWQSLDQYRVTLKCYNLAVARNVSYFSGWDEREFNGSLQQLRRRIGPAFYGITTGSGQVAGYVSNFILDELVKQWGLLVGRVYPAASIVSKLSLLCSNRWYSELEKKIVEFEQENRPIAMYGEEDAVTVLLSFSRMSISILKQTCTLADNEQALLNALSVLLPLTQFCLNEQIWYCSIGSEAASRSPEEWLRLGTKASNDGVPRPSDRAGYVKPSQRSTDDRKSNMDWFLGEDMDEPLSNLIVIPNSILAKIWKDIVVNVSCSDRTVAESMEELHNCMLCLRKSFTAEAVERASLHVAAAVLQIAMHPECENGFICFHHAALFAGQGAKEGSNDIHFKVPLPEKEDCTPHEALMILGRADCLLALHFYQESTFLCGFVTSVCAIRRQSCRGKLDEEWTVVSITAYNSSVMIRFAALELLQHEEKKLFDFEWWDSATREELCQARQGGLNFLWEKQDEIQQLQTGDPITPSFPLQPCPVPEEQSPETARPIWEGGRIVEISEFSHSTPSDLEVTTAGDFEPTKEAVPQMSLLETHNSSYFEHLNICEV